MALHITIKDIFTYKTIAHLSDHLLNQSQCSTRALIRTEQGLLKGNIALLPIQTWFFNQQITNLHHWNQSFLIKIPELNIDLLKKSIALLESYHDGLHIRYRKTAQAHLSYEQYYAKPKFTQCNILNLASLSSEDKLQDTLTAWQNHFHLMDGSLHSCDA